MTKEVYQTLSEKEKAMYDELVGFSRRLAERMEEVISLLKKAIEGQEP